MGDTTDGVPWKQRAVTFLENHDTGYRTNDDGTAAAGSAVRQFRQQLGSGAGLRLRPDPPRRPLRLLETLLRVGAQTCTTRSAALINARKVAGVNAGSALYTQDNARRKGVYAALVRGKRARSMSASAGVTPTGSRPRRATRLPRVRRRGPAGRSGSPCPATRPSGRPPCPLPCLPRRRTRAATRSRSRTRGWSRLNLSAGRDRQVIQVRVGLGSAEAMNPKLHPARTWGRVKAEREGYPDTDCPLDGADRRHIAARIGRV